MEFKQIFKELETLDCRIMPNNELQTGLNSSNVFFTSDILYDKIKPKSKNKKFLRALELAEEINWRCIGENHYIIKNRVLKKGLVGNLRIPLFSFQNEKTLEVCKNSPLDGGVIKNSQDIITWFTSLKSLKYAKLYAKYNLKQDFSYYLDIKKSSYCIINGVILLDSVVSEYGKQNYAKKTREENLLDIVFPIMYGPREIESLEEAYCLVTRVNLKSNIFGKSVFEYSLHHSCTNEEGSVLKMVVDNKRIEPSKSLLNQNLINEPDLIKDIMNTQLISNGIHKTIHNSGVSCQGFDIYPKSQIPYIARSERNYKEVLDFLGLDEKDFPDYEEYYNINCNPLTEDVHKSPYRVKI